MDKLSKARRSENMRRIRAKDMRPEMFVRRTVHGMGYRYRLHSALLPGKPDLSFPSRHKVIFVHGCFWHRHRARACRISRLPKSNTGYWHPKLEANEARDKRHRRQLRKLGWDVLVIWECELGNVGRLRARIREFLGKPGMRGAR
ncbi:DNA mismatch endonuclease Vsr [Candidatus Poribacteria bacterium]|nr:DNA mismatch endonuclease Vsr [Candidatus Poribacteria bacterium]